MKALLASALAALPLPGVGGGAGHDLTLDPPADVEAGHRVGGGAMAAARRLI